MTTYMKKLFSLILSFVFVMSVFGQDAVGDWRTQVSSGNWNDYTTWEKCTVAGTPGTWVDAGSGEYPGSSGNITTTVTILNGDTINGNIDIVGDNSTEVLQINAGGVLNMGSNIINGPPAGPPFFEDSPFNELTIDGTLTSNTSIDVVTMSIGSTGIFNTSYASTGWWSHTTPSMTTNNGLIEFSGSSPQKIKFYDSGLTYNDITISGTVGTEGPSGDYTYIYGDLTIDASSSLTVTGDHPYMFISGDVTNNGTFNPSPTYLYFSGNLVNNGSMTVTNNTFFFNGSGKSFSGSGSLSGSLNYFGVGAGSVGSLTLSASATVTATNLYFSASNDALTIQPGAKLTVTSLASSSGDVTINSDATGSGSLISGASISGVDFKRYVSGAQWHIISSAVSGYSISNYASFNSVDTYNGDIALGIYNESTDAWSMYPDDAFTLSSAGNILTAKGYLSGRPTSGTLSFTGSLIVGNQSIGITSSASPGNAWNCIGNPYSSSINVATIISTNTALLDNSYEAVYIFNGTTYSGLTTGYIQPGQGFFVKSETGGGSFSFTTSMQSHQNPTFYKKALEYDSNTEIKLLATSNKITDATCIHFSEEPTYGLDPGKDIGKFTGSGVNFSLYNQLLDDNGVKFEYQALPEDSIDKITIPIGLDYKDGGVVTFSTELLDLPDGTRVILEDRLLEKYIDLQAPSASYTIEVAENTEGYGRFFLHTFDPAGVTSINSKQEKFNVFALNKEVHIIGTISTPAPVNIYDLVGRKSYEGILDQGNLNIISLDQLEQGIYIVNFKTENTQHSKKVYIK